MKPKKLAKAESEDNHKEAQKLKYKLENIHFEISDLMKNEIIIDDNLGKINDPLDGSNQDKACNLKKRLCPKDITEPPAAKKDKNGNLITDRKQLEKLMIENYVERMQPNEISVGLEDTENLKKS